MIGSSSIQVRKLGEGDQARSAPTEAPERRLFFRDVTWDSYLTLADWIGERALRVTFDRGSLELMSPSPTHEQLKRILGTMVQILIDAFELPSEELGSTTFRRKDLDAGLEPDECFYIASASLARSVDVIDEAPPPDLVIEIDISSSSIDRIKLYERMGVPEIWRFDGQSLRILRLTRRGRYVPRRSSPTFGGIGIEDLCDWIDRARTADKTAWRKAFRAWVGERVNSTPKHKDAKRRRES
jgi:Uma2 family endonuclease